jgi:hypothetical protein
VLNRSYCRLQHSSQHWTGIIVHFFGISTEIDWPRAVNANLKAVGAHRIQELILHHRAAAMGGDHRFADETVDCAKPERKIKAGIATTVRASPIVNTPMNTANRRSTRRSSSGSRP